MHGVRSKKTRKRQTQYKALIVKLSHKLQKSKISLTQSKMADQTVMSEAITKAVVDATRIAIQTMAEMPPQRSESQRGPKLGGPALKQPQFNWEAAEKYTKWKAFTLEARNVLSTYNTQEQDKIAIVKNWLDRKGLHYIESLTEGEKQACNTLQGLFDTLATKFRPQFNETIKSLQFRKLCRFEGESAEEWIGRLCVAAVECNYRDRLTT